MISRLRLRFFAHSWRSDWNHGNAHFLRGLVDELQKLGHDVRCYEPENAWSVVNLLAERSASKSFEQVRSAFPDLVVRTYDLQRFAMCANQELTDADVVVVHEWTDPQIVKTLFQLRTRHSFALLLHDTHHRSYTSPADISHLSPHMFDGVLAFGEAVRQLYLDRFKVQRAWTFHEAADAARFYPIANGNRTEVNWIGNWGDGERSSELEHFLIAPFSTLPSDTATVYGVRYPRNVQEYLSKAGIQYRGYLPNLAVPTVYSRSLFTLHIPRRCYSNGLSGIPTIRMFEALSCGIPLICSPWQDSERLFSPGQDFISVADGKEMKATMDWLMRDDLARDQLGKHGLNTIRERHTCRHRAIQFLDICGELGK